MTDQPDNMTAEPVVQQQAPHNIVNEAAGILGLGGLGSFLDPKDRAELEKIAGNAQPQQDTPAQDNPDTAQSDDPADPQTQTPATPAQEPAKQDNAEPARKSVLGLNKKKADAKNDLVIETPEHILSAVKSRYGQDIKDIKELPKFFESIDKWRSASQTADELTKKYSAIEAEIMALPQEFHEAFQELRNGGDYKKPFHKPAGIDYNKPADKQDIKTLVNHYFPGKFADTDFAEEDKSQALTIAQEAAQMKFSAEKSIHDTKRADVATKTERMKEAQKAAVDSSVKGLQERFPEMDTEAFNQVKSAIEGGPQKVLSLFFNNDGTAKPDAAIKLTMSLFGESELLPDAMEVAAHIAETKLNEDRLTRGADGPKPHRGAAQPEQVPAEIKKQIDEMQRIADAKKKVF